MAGSTQLQPNSPLFNAMQISSKKIKKSNAHIPDKFILKHFKKNYFYDSYNICYLLIFKELVLNILCHKKMYVKITINKNIKVKHIVIFQIKCFLYKK